MSWSLQYLKQVCLFLKVSLLSGAMAVVCLAEGMSADTDGPASVAAQVYEGIYPEDSEYERQRLLAERYAPEQVVWLSLQQGKSLALLRRQQTGKSTQGVVLILKTGVESRTPENRTLWDIAAMVEKDSWDSLMLFLPELPPPPVVLHGGEKQASGASVADLASRGDDVTADELGVAEDPLPASDKNLGIGASAGEDIYVVEVKQRLRAASELLKEQAYSKTVLVVAGATTPVLGLINPEQPELNFQALILLNGKSSNTVVKEDFFAKLDPALPVLDLLLGNQLNERLQHAQQQRQRCAEDNHYEAYQRLQLPAQPASIGAAYNRSAKRIRSWLKQLQG